MTAGEAGYLAAVILTASLPLTGPAAIAGGLLTLKYLAGRGRGRDGSGGRLSVAAAAVVLGVVALVAALLAGMIWELCVYARRGF